LIHSSLYKLHKIKLNLILCNLYKKLCIKLVSIKELYYDTRPTKSQGVVCYYPRPALQSQASHTISCVLRLFPDVCQRASNYEATLYFRNFSTTPSVIARNILDLCVPFGVEVFHTPLKQR